MNPTRSDSFEDGARPLGRADAQEGAHFRNGSPELGAAVAETGKVALHTVQEKAAEVKKDLAALYADGEAALRENVAKQPLAAIGLAVLAGALFSTMLFRK